MTEDGGGNGSGARDPRPAIDAVLETLADDPRLVHVEHTAASAGRTATLADALEPTLAAHVPHEQLWSHQVTAIEALRGGRSTVIATGTGSGKSLCFQIPAAEAVARGETVLMVFPTKALARDQLRSLASWRVPGLTVAAYDGDCGREERQWVRTHANVIVTNPEMLHQSILAEHARWAPFLGRLGLVVVDELHVLRGIFGTHVAHVLRRLRRLAALHGASPCCAFGSATIGNPRELAAELEQFKASIVKDVVQS
jgi:DEAD/DEAH box helicase domain-containing protein